MVLLGVFMVRGVEYGKAIRAEHPPNPKLRIVTYPSFSSLFGPATPLIEEFKKRFPYDIEVTTAGDSVLMVQRLIQQKTTARVDVVIGLDPLTLERAQNDLPWQKIAVDWQRFAPEVQQFRNDFFVPFDWSPMTFLYREGEIEPPHKLSDLKEARFQKTLALQDPKLSTPGQQFLLWTLDVFHEGAFDFLTSLRPNVAALAPSWALSYGFFKRGQAKMVFTYQTSLLFHWLEEKNRAYHAVDFEDGHPLQVEFVSIPEQCLNCEGALKFVEFLISKEAQQILIARNFMFPVIKEATVGSEFEKLVPLKVRPWAESKKWLMNIEAASDRALSLLK